MEGKITLKQAVEMLHAINDGFTEQVEGDPMDMDKHVRNLIKFIRQTLNKRKVALPHDWAEGLSPDQKEAFKLDDIQAEWSYEQILKHYNEEADNTPEEEAINLVDDMLLKAAQIKKQDRVRETFLLSKIVQKSGLPIKVGDLRSKVQSMRNDLKSSTSVGGDDEGNGATEITLNTHTEVALAVKDLLNGMHPICVEAGLVYKFMGSHWVAYPPEQVKQFIALNFTHLDIMKRNSDIDGVYKQLLILCDNELNQNQIAFVNVANGMVLENQSNKLLTKPETLEHELQRIREGILNHPSAQMGMWSNEEIKAAQENAVKRFVDGMAAPLNFTTHQREFGATYVLPYLFIF